MFSEIENCHCDYSVYRYVWIQAYTYVKTFPIFQACYVSSQSHQRNETSWLTSILESSFVLFSRKKQILNFNKVMVMARVLIIF